MFKKLIINKLIFFLCSAFLTSFLCFILFYIAGSNENMQNDSIIDGKFKSSRSSLEQINEMKNEKVNLPFFYFSLAPISVPETLLLISNLKCKKELSDLIESYGNWEEIKIFYNAKSQLKSYLERNSKNQNETINRLLPEIKSQKNWSKLNDSILQKIEFTSCFNSSDRYELEKYLKNYFVAFHRMKNKSCVWKNYFPKILFHKKNRLHLWLMAFGDSFTNGSFKDFCKKAKWTFALVIPSMILTFILGTLLGVWLSGAHTLFKNTIRHLLMINVSFPLFLIFGILLMMSSELLPSYYKIAFSYPILFAQSDSVSSLESTLKIIYSMSLPVLLHTLGNLGYYTLQTEISMNEELMKPYVSVAISKGLNDFKVKWSHCFKNSLFQLLNHFTGLIALSITGAVILESTFSIPGIGLAIKHAIKDQNTIELSQILFLTGITTHFVLLIGDFLQILVDPRILKSSEKIELN